MSDMGKINKKNRHMWIAIGCGQDGAGFRVENGKHICTVCEVDFTEEVKEIMKVIQKSLLNVPN